MRPSGGCVGTITADYGAGLVYSFACFSQSPPRGAVPDRGALACSLSPVVSVLVPFVFAVLFSLAVSASLFGSFACPLSLAASLPFSVSLVAEFDFVSISLTVGEAVITVSSLNDNTVVSLMDEWSE